MSIGQIIYPFMHPELYNHPSKSWSYFIMLVSLSIALCNLLVHIEFLAKRKWMMAIKVNLEASNATIDVPYMKYSCLLILGLVCFFGFIFGRECTVVIFTFTFMWFSFWTVRLLLVLIVVDMMKSKLKLILTRTQEMKGMCRKELLLEVHEEYASVQSISEEINRFAALTFTATTYQFSIQMIDIFYWGILGIFKGLKSIHEHRELTAAKLIKVIAEVFFCYRATLLYSCIHYNVCCCLQEL